MFALIHGDYLPIILSTRAPIDGNGDPCVAVIDHDARAVTVWARATAAQTARALAEIERITESAIV